MDRTCLKPEKQANWGLIREDGDIIPIYRYITYSLICPVSENGLAYCLGSCAIWSIDPRILADGSAEGFGAW